MELSTSTAGNAEEIPNVDDEANERLIAAMGNSLLCLSITSIKGLDTIEARAKMVEVVAKLRTQNTSLTPDVCLSTSKSFMKLSIGFAYVGAMFAALGEELSATHTETTSASASTDVTEDDQITSSITDAQLLESTLEK